MSNVLGWRDSKNQAHQVHLGYSRLEPLSGFTRRNDVRSRTCKLGLEDQATLHSRSDKDVREVEKIF